MEINLTLTSKQEKILVELAKQFNDELGRSNASFPNATTVQQLKFVLQEVLLSQSSSEDFLNSLKNKQIEEPLCIAHHKSIIRNLPWQLALDSIGERPLYKAIKTRLPRYQSTNGLPLKILFMVATPSGVTRLNFEREELMLLKALIPLRAKGLVDIHFTNDGSLENLEEKLFENKFHVLHFSGHGGYNDGKGTLALEVPLLGDLKKTDVSALIALFERLDIEGHRPDLVVLSACKTAQGESGELLGIADTLIEGIIPAVVAMSSNILDDCASVFTTEFYDLLSKGISLPYAFHEATKLMRSFEVQKYSPAERQLSDGKYLASGQWLIPQLLLGQEVNQLVDKEALRSELSFTFDNNYINLEKSLSNLHVRHQNYVFAGRRKSIQFAFQALKSKNAILVIGQGGVGKTAFAEHLAIRLMTSRQSAKLFIHSEKAPTVDNLLRQLKAYLIKEKKQDSIISELALKEKLSDKFLYLYNSVKEHCYPIFIFDNVETFQWYNADGGTWYWNINQHEDVLQLINILNQQGTSPIIVTGRYPVIEFKEWHVCNLNTVPFGDFLKKCYQLSFSELSSNLTIEKHLLSTVEAADKRKTTFLDIVQLLYNTLGGNYRSLKFFDELYSKDKENIFSLGSKLTDLKKHIQESKEVLYRMSENLVFERLLSYLNEEDKDTLSLLAQFRIPVLGMTIGMQRGGTDRSKSFIRLNNLTLVELQMGVDKRNRYYVIPLVKELLRRANFHHAQFSKIKAGAYHEYVFDEKIYLNSLDELAEAFEWYYEGKDLEGANRTGLSLNDFYYKIQQYRLSAKYGLRTEEITGEDTNARIWNNIGISISTLGKPEQGLEYLKKALSYYQKVKDPLGEGGILNNINHIYYRKGDFQQALNYLHRALTIFQGINNRSSQGTTLTNIGEIHRNIGQYEQALHYLNQAILISQEIGDRRSEGSILNNISQVYLGKGEYNNALTYLQESLEIIQEIGDRRVEGNVLLNISKIYHAFGDHDTALKYLEKSLILRRSIGDRRGECATLNDIGLNFLGKGEYDIALKYYHISLHTSKTIYYPLEESITLGNIAQIHQVRGDYKRAQQYLETALEISERIEDISGIATLLWNLGDLFMVQERFEEAVIPIFRALKGFEHLGSANEARVWPYLNSISEKIGVEKVQQIIEEFISNQQ